MVPTSVEDASPCISVVIVIRREASRRTAAVAKPNAAKPKAAPKAKPQGADSGTKEKPDPPQVTKDEMDQFKKATLGAEDGVVRLDQSCLYELDAVVAGALGADSMPADPAVEEGIRTGFSGGVCHRYGIHEASISTYYH